MNKLSKLFFLFTLLLGGWCLSSCEEMGGIGTGGDGDGDDQETTNSTGSTITLFASSSIIVADGEEAATLTVMFDSVDVTNSAYIYMNKKRMSGSRFTTETPGTYEFFASYKGRVSKTISITAANPALYVALPEDTQAEQFSDFQRKVLITEGTGTWCGYCPYMITALELFSDSASNADKAVIVATHSGDEFSSTASEAVIQTLRIADYPSSVFNLNAENILTNDHPSVNAEKINSMVGMELMEEAAVGIAAATAVSADSTKVSVRAAVKIGLDGNYRVNAWLIEDKVAAYQSNNWEEFGDGTANVLIDHMHILRDASCTSPIQGKLLGEKGACTAGEVLEFYHEFDGTKANVANMANCKIVVMVTAAQGTSSNYFVNNVIECHVGESVPFAYN